MSVPTRSCASFVDAPRCGSASTLGCLASCQSLGGSCAWTSSAAPATRPLSSAASSASSSISAQRRLVLDTLAARGVHDPHAGLDLGERVLPDQVLRLRRERRVQRDVVGGLEQVLQAAEGDVSALG